LAAILRGKPCGLAKSLLVRPHDARTHGALSHEARLRDPLFRSRNHAPRLHRRGSLAGRLRISRRLLAAGDLPHARAELISVTNFMLATISSSWKCGRR